MKTIAFGEIIFDIYPEDALLGGAPLNFCAHLSSLGDTAYLLSAVSETDRYGKEALEGLRRYRIRDELIQKNSLPTGYCDITLDERKVPTYRIARDSAHDHILVTPDLLERMRNIRADVFYFNTLIQRRENSRVALKEILRSLTFRDIFCDINLRKDCYDSESVALCLRHATYFKLSDEEIPALSDAQFLPDCKIEDVPMILCRRYPNIRYAILTLGKDGSMVYDGAVGKGYRSDVPEKIPVVSTVGAGDCYGATFLHGIYSGLSVPEAMRAATERSNIVVSHKAAVPF